MVKLTKNINWKEALKIKISEGIDLNKFDIEITETILEKNGWERSKHDTFGDGWTPPSREWVYDETISDWKPDDSDSADFDECFIWYKEQKDAWCYKFNFGTFVFDIKSIAELEIILAREGFVYSFDI